MTTQQYLTFFIRGEEYAVSILRVREIIEYATVTRIPAMPIHIHGVINLRGAVLPVIDLAAKFGREETTASRTTCIVVVETEMQGEIVIVGLIADSVSEVADITAAQIEPPPSFGTNIHVEFLIGMGKLENRLVLVLDINRVLSPFELSETIAAVEEAESLHNEHPAEPAQL